MVTNYWEGRGATKQEGGGGASEILPLQKGRADIILAMLKGGGVTKCSEVVSTQELEALAILMGEGGRCKKFPPFQNGGAGKILPCLDIMHILYF